MEPGRFFLQDPRFIAWQIDSCQNIARVAVSAVSSLVHSVSELAYGQVWKVILEEDLLLEKRMTAPGSHLNRIYGDRSSNA